jgi:hypothetical protein
MLLKSIGCLLLDNRASGLSTSAFEHFAHVLFFRSFLVKVLWL